MFIGNMKAWRAIPADVGAGLEEASTMVKAIMDQFPNLKSPSDPAKVATQDLEEIYLKMMDTAAKAEAAVGMCGAQSGVQSAFLAFQPTALSLLATYTSAAASPIPGEPAVRLAFTTAFKTGLQTAMSAAVTAIAGAWDMNTCPATLPGPPPHGPGLVTVGCKTIFINGLPAVMKGHQIIEAAGGPNAIQVGCSNVFFGDKAPSSGDSGGGKTSAKAPKGARSSSTGSGSGASSGTSKPESRSDPTEVTLEISVLDVLGAKQEGLQYRIQSPDGRVSTGKLDGEGKCKVKSANPGVFVVSFPTLDGEDWDGDGVEPIPAGQKRSLQGQHTVAQGERLPKPHLGGGAVRNARCAGEQESGSGRVCQAHPAAL